MNFQFCCPNNHLLQGDDTQAGSVITCPVCQVKFIIPSPAPQSPVASPSAGHEAFPPGGEGTSPFSPSRFPTDMFPGQNSPSENPLDFRRNSQPFTVGSGEYGSTRQFAPKTASTVTHLHIPCPNGHIMEITRDFLGEEVVCPQCSRDFVLRFENTLEYRKERDAKETVIATKYAQRWLQFAIALAVAIFLMVIILIYV